MYAVCVDGEGVLDLLVGELGGPDRAGGEVERGHDPIARHPPHAAVPARHERGHDVALPARVPVEQAPAVTLEVGQHAEARLALEADVAGPVVEHVDDDYLLRRGGHDGAVVLVEVEVGARRVPEDLVEVQREDRLDGR